MTWESVWPASPSCTLSPMLREIAWWASPRVTSSAWTWRPRRFRSWQRFLAPDASLWVPKAALSPLVWARAAQRGLLYTADANGQLFAFDEESGFSASRGKTLLAPVGPMAVTFDGRVFGFCGPGIAKMFCYAP